MEYFAEFDQIRNQAEQLEAQFTQGSDLVMILMVITGVIGVLWCFLGLKFVRFWAALLGGCMGFVLGMGAAAVFNFSSTVSLAVGCVIGILLAVLSASIYHVGVFLVVWSASISVILTFVRPEAFVGTVLCGAAGVVIALLTIRFTEPITMVMTGIYGATVLANTIMFFIPFEEAWIQPVLTVIFSIVGIGVQILLESGKRKRMHLKKAAEIRKKYSTENEVEKARAMIDNLEEEGKGHRYED